MIASADPPGLPGEPDQVDLFGEDPGRGSPVEESARALRRFSGDVAAIAPARRGPGRPEGSKNRLTADLIRFLQARYRDPLLGIADIAATAPMTLARVMVPDGQAITESAVAKAWDMWRACSFELAEYMHTKQPRALTITPDSAPLMNFLLHTDQLTMQTGAMPASPDQVFGFSETQAKSMFSETQGGEVLDQQVLEVQVSPVKSNG